MTFQAPAWDAPLSDNLLFCAPCWTLTDPTAAAPKPSAPAWFKFAFNPKIITVIIIIIRVFIVFSVLVSVELVRLTEVTESDPCVRACLRVCACLCACKSASFDHRLNLRLQRMFFFLF